MIQTLLFNLVGEHAARQAEVQAEINGGSSRTQMLQLKKAEEIEALIKEICEGILTHDRFLDPFFLKLLPSSPFSVSFQCIADISYPLYFSL